METTVHRQVGRVELRGFIQTTRKKGSNSRGRREAYMNEMLEDCPNNGPWDLSLSEGEGVGGGLAMSGLGGSDP